MTIQELRDTIEQEARIAAFQTKQILIDVEYARVWSDTKSSFVFGRPTYYVVVGMTKESRGAPEPTHQFYF